jgi:hypothetical protein
MATETRTSEQGNVFDASLVREFLLTALSRDPVSEAVDEMLFEHVAEGRSHISVVSESLKPFIEEILAVASSEDWRYIAEVLVRDAREALEDQVMTETDPGYLRERLASILGGRDSVARYRVRWIVRQISRRVGIGPAEVLANAQADAGALKAAADQGVPSAPSIRSDVKVIVTGEVASALIARAGHPDRHGEGSWPLRDGTRTANPQRALTDALVTLAEGSEAGAEQSSAPPSAAPEAADQSQAFVRPLTTEEALGLLRKGEKTEHPATRARAAVLLASNAGHAPEEIASRLDVVVLPEVHKIIAEFNERGLASLDLPR